MKTKTQKLIPVRPNSVKIGDAVLSTIGANNLPPQQFRVIKIEQAIADSYRPGLFLQLIELMDGNGFGGWVTLWDRPEAGGEVFHVNQGDRP